jgi:hypothetical protein
LVFQNARAPSPDRIVSVEGVIICLLVDVEKPKPRIALLDVRH